MARFRFNEGKKYAGRLIGVHRKAVDNRRLDLVRLEFEIFQFLLPDTLASTGKIACRDVVVGRGIDLTIDEDAMSYVAALRVTAPQSVRSWLALEQRAPWVMIVFGPHDDFDQRNSFASILPFDPLKHRIQEYDLASHQDWVRVGKAAEELETSESTVRRRVQSWEIEWGTRLVRPRQPGGHRYLNLRLLRNLWD